MQFRRMFASLGTGKTKPVAAQYAHVRIRIRIQKTLNQHRKPRLLCSTPASAGLYTPGEAACSACGGLKAGLTYFVKMPRQNAGDESAHKAVCVFCIEKVSDEEALLTKTGCQR